MLSDLSEGCAGQERHLKPHAAGSRCLCCSGTTHVNKEFSIVTSPTPNANHVKHSKTSKQSCGWNVVSENGRVRAQDGALHYVSTHVSHIPQGLALTSIADTLWACDIMTTHPNDSGMWWNDLILHRVVFFLWEHITFSKYTWHDLLMILMILHRFIQCQINVYVSCLHVKCVYMYPVFTMSGMCTCILSSQCQVCVHVSCLHNVRYVYMYPVFTMSGMCTCTLSSQCQVCVHVPCLHNVKYVYVYPVFTMSGMCTCTLSSQCQVCVHVPCLHNVRYVYTYTVCTSHVLDNLDECSHDCQQDSCPKVTWVRTLPLDLAHLVLSMGSIPKTQSCVWDRFAFIRSVLKYVCSCNVGPTPGKGHWSPWGRVPVQSCWACHRRLWASQQSRHQSGSLAWKKTLRIIQRCESDSPPVFKIVHGTGYCPSPRYPEHGGQRA